MHDIILMTDILYLLLVGLVYTPFAMGLLVWVWFALYLPIAIFNAVIKHGEEHAAKQRDIK